MTRIGRPDGRAAGGKAVHVWLLTPSRGCQMAWGVGGPLTEQPAPCGSWGQTLDPEHVKGAGERGWALPKMTAPRLVAARH